MGGGRWCGHRTGQADLRILVCKCVCVGVENPVEVLVVVSTLDLSTRCQHHTNLNIKSTAEFKIFLI